MIAAKDLGTRAEREIEQATDRDTVRIAPVSTFAVRDAANEILPHRTSSSSAITRPKRTDRDIATVTPPVDATAGSLPTSTTR
jgi:hypothetical protein